MEGHYLYSLASFYISLWLVATIFSIAVEDDDAFIKAVFLGILFFANQPDSLWLVPRNMFTYHAGAVLLMLFAMQNVKHWKAFLIASYIMFLSDALWMAMPALDIEPNAWAFPYDIFYWQSILNITNAALAIILIKGCYHSHRIAMLKKRKKVLEDGNGTIDASEEPGSIGTEVVI